MLLTLLLTAIILSFLLSGMESAVLSVSRVRVRHSASEDDPAAMRLLALLDDREGLLGAVTVANHIANVTAFALIAWHIVAQLGPWGYAVAFALALPVFIVLLEMLPKTLFRRFPYRILLRLLPLLAIIAWFHRPFRAMSNLPLLNQEQINEKAQGNRDDLKTLVASIAEQRLLPTSAAQLIQSVLDLRQITAGSVMVPLSRLIAVSGDVPAVTALQLARQHSLMTLPVLGDHAGGGYTGIFDASTLPAHLPPDRLVRQHMRPLEEVEASLPALAVLQRLRRRGISLALVRDQSTPTQHAIGIVTEEDLISALLPSS